MKVEIPNRVEQDVRQPPSGRRLLRLVGFSVFGFIAVMLVAVAYTTFGGGLFDQQRGLSEKWSIMAGSFRRNAGDTDMPELVFDVPFKEMRKIYQKREQALQAGHLVQGVDDFVKGSIRFENETIPIRLRLKGDDTDHLRGRKWSFRVRTRNNAEILGMRRFSIQAPLTRHYQAEPMFFAVMRAFDVLAPRYEFVNVVINGEALGIMALEEFFSKELLESSRRREGVILRFDESDLWDARDSLARDRVGFHGAFDNFANARIDSIASSRVAESPVLSKQYAVSASLLKRFTQGDIEASDVFDAELLGRFLAVAEMMGSWHSVRWHNMRFYFNPISAKLEPIAFDANMQNHLTRDASIVDLEQIAIRMLEDEDVWQVYLETLRELDAMIDDGRLESIIRDEEAGHLERLRSEFRDLEAFNTAYLAERSDLLLTRMQRSTNPLANSLNLKHEPGLFPLLAHFTVDPESDTLLVETAIPYDVEVTSAAWVNETTGERQDAAIDGLPLVLPPRALYGAGTVESLTLNAIPDDTSWQLRVRSRIAGRAWNRESTAQFSAGHFEASPIPSATVEVLRASHDFVDIDEASRRVRIGAGDWLVEKHLVIPEGYGLDIAPGTKLRFSSDSILLVHGDVQWLGTSDAPIEIGPVNGSRWPGLVVSGADVDSNLEHVIIRDTSSVILPGWTLTGGINFYQSDVQIRESRFSNSHGEDALNIIESRFTIEDTEISNTASDAFDSDFSDGTVSGGLFTNIGYAGGGDAIDISGSEVTVTGVRFEQVYDKALSVGEGSTMMASAITIDGTGTGAAAKDGSELQLSDTAIIGASFAGMTAYIKKPEYGPARIIASNVSVQASETITLVQNGSQVAVDGNDAETTDVDVDALYETVMRKGLQ